MSRCILRTFHTGVRAQRLYSSAVSYQYLNNPFVKINQWRSYGSELGEAHQYFGVKTGDEQNKAVKKFLDIRSDHTTYTPPPKISQRLCANLTTGPCQNRGPFILCPHPTPWLRQ